MEISKILFLSAILVAAGSTAYGRIGEKTDDLQKRYGAPNTTTPVGCFQCAVYQKADFLITVYYKNGSSVMEVFSGRLDQPTARQLAVQVAASCPCFAAADADHEAALRAATGITEQDEMFWTWTKSGAAMAAAYNPVERTLTFFSQPTVYADVHKALASEPL